MPRNRFKKIAEEAGKKTDEALASELTDLTKLTRDQLKHLLPDEGDAARFAELMAIVDSSAKDNNKLAKLKKNIDRVGPVVLKVLKALI